MGIIGFIVRLKLMAAFLAALVIGQFVGGVIVLADHQLIGPNRVCGPDGDYWHVHWNHPGGQKRFLSYEYSIYDHSGGGYLNYVDALDDGALNWNNPPGSLDQEFVELIGDQTSSDPDIAVLVDDFSFFSEAGLAQTHPDQCPLSGQPINTPTHLTEVQGSSVIIYLNSSSIEGDPDPDHTRTWTAAHEFGHSIGLGHNSQDDPRVLMHLAGEDTPEVPLQDDMDNLSNNQYPFGHND